MKQQHELGDILSQRDIQRPDEIRLETLGGFRLELGVVVVGVPLVEHFDADNHAGLDRAGDVDDLACGAGAQRLMEQVRAGGGVVDERTVVVDQRGVQSELGVDRA